MPEVTLVLKKTWPSNSVLFKTLALITFIDVSINKIKLFFIVWKRIYQFCSMRLKPASENYQENEKEWQFSFFNLLSLKYHALDIIHQTLKGRHFSWNAFVHVNNRFCFRVTFLTFWNFRKILLISVSSGNWNSNFFNESGLICPYWCLSQIL